MMLLLYALPIIVAAISFCVSFTMTALLWRGQWKG